MFKSLLPLLETSGLRLNLETVAFFGGALVYGLVLRKQVHKLRGFKPSGNSLGDFECEVKDDRIVFRERYNQLGLSGRKERWVSFDVMLDEIEELRIFRSHAESSRYFKTDIALNPHLNAQDIRSKLAWLSGKIERPEILVGKPSSLDTVLLRAPGLYLFIGIKPLGIGAIQHLERAASDTDSPVAEERTERYLR